MPAKSAKNIWHLLVLAILPILLTLSLSACGSPSSSDDPANPGVTTYTVGGFVSDLTGTGLILQNNDDDEPVTMNGQFTFDTPIADGTDYEVTVLIHPTGQSCDVTLGGGTIMSQNVINVTVQCNSTTTPKLVFVTSLFGTGDLSSWDDTIGSGITGLAAADAICQDHANRAGLSGTFVAWLSDSNDDAYCRVHGLARKKAANCGQVTLPTNAGPWIRTDGYPFAPAIDQFTQSIMYTPIKFDENGAIPVKTKIYTGTDWRGTATGSLGQCFDWTIGGGGFFANVGDADGTGSGWHGGDVATCDQLFHLACFQTGPGDPLPPFSTTGKKVFITSTPTTGNLGGLVGADVTCQAEADAQTLGGNYKAWLSTSTVNAIDRLTSNGPWMRIDGVKIADNKADLTDGEIFTSISYDAAGNNTSVVTREGAWTGTNASGLKTAANCGNWLIGDGTAAGTSGWESWINSIWTDDQPYGCFATRKFYCFEDSPAAGSNYKIP